MESKEFEEKFDLIGRSVTEVSKQVLEERANQLLKWGVQSYPSFDEILIKRGKGEYEAQGMCHNYEIPSESRAKFMCNTHMERGDVTWPHIVIEELSEAISTLDERKCREEIVQMIAVCFAWIEDIDRRLEGEDAQKTD